MFSFKNLIVVLFAIYLITNVLKKDGYKCLIGVGVLWFLMNNTEPLDNIPNTPNINEENINNNKVTDDGGKISPKVKASIINTGPYDGLCLKTGNKEYWMKSPDETSLVPNDNLYTYLSSQGPIKMKISDQNNLIGPPVDGVEGSPKKMFMWANNITSPLCCPSTFSTSTGCLCTSKNQRDFIAARGLLDENPQNDNPIDEIEN